MSRIDPTNEALAADLRQELDRQAQRYGSPLVNHLVLARRPTIFRGFRAMWNGIDDSALIDRALISLLNLRVASLLGCGL